MLSERNQIDLLYAALSIDVIIDEPFLQTGTLTNSEDPDKIPHNTSLHEGLYCLQDTKKNVTIDMHRILDISTSDTLTFKTTVS